MLTHAPREFAKGICDFDVRLRKRLNEDAVQLTRQIVEILSCNLAMMTLTNSAANENVMDIATNRRRAAYWNNMTAESDN